MAFSSDSRCSSKGTQCSFSILIIFYLNTFKIILWFLELLRKNGTRSIVAAHPHKPAIGLYNFACLAGTLLWECFCPLWTGTSYIDLHQARWVTVGVTEYSFICQWSYYLTFFLLSFFTSLSWLFWRTPAIDHGYIFFFFIVLNLTKGWFSLFPCRLKLIMVAGIFFQIPAPKLRKPTTSLQTCSVYIDCIIYSLHYDLCHR